MDFSENEPSAPLDSHDENINSVNETDLEGHEKVQAQENIYDKLEDPINHLEKSTFPNPTENGIVSRFITGFKYPFTAYKLCFLRFYLLFQKQYI